MRLSLDLDSSRSGSSFFLYCFRATEWKL